MFKYFSANNTRKYVENENKVWRNLYPEFGDKTLAPKFAIGDNERITKKTNLFDKG